MAKEYKKIVAEIGRRSPVNGEINGEINGKIDGEINSLSSALKDVYLIVKSTPGIKIKQMAEARYRAESTVGKQLNELIVKGFVEYRGSKKTGGYYVIEK